MSKSLIEITYDYLSSQKGPTKFDKIWAQVKKEANLSDEDAAKMIGQFYTSLSLDGRFTSFENNTWDLRSRYAYAPQADMKEVYDGADVKNDDSEEVKEEEKEYAGDETLNEVKENDDEEKDDNETDDEETSEEDYEDNNSSGKGF